MSINTAAETSVNTKKLLEIQDPVATPITAELSELRTFLEKFTTYKFEIFQKTQLMEAHWTPLWDDVKNGE